MKDGVTVAGLDDVKQILDNIDQKHSRNLMRATIHGIAGEIAKGARKRAPKDKGSLKKSIKTRRRKSHPAKPTSEVYFTTGKAARADGFHWRFIEKGTQGIGNHPGIPAQPFLAPARHEVMSNMTAILRQQFSKKLEAAVRREAKKAAKKAGIKSK